MRIVLATGNAGKVHEIRRIMRGSGVRFVPLDSFPGVRPADEECGTFRGNAARKALAVARQTGCIAIAEDSGLEVEALGWRPGVRSARYAGLRSSDEANNAKLLRELAAIPEGSRQARFRCLAVLARPDGRVVVRQGTCRGVIAMRPRGSGGFGYDPLFIVPKMGRTFAELSPTEKSALSHRGKALRRLRPAVSAMASASS